MDLLEKYALTFMPGIPQELARYRPPHASALLGRISLAQAIPPIATTSA